MSKYLTAALLLALLLGGSLLNARHVDRLTEELIARIDEVCALAERGETEKARAASEAAEGLWRAAEGYTSVFVRHAESDAVTDAFGDLYSALCEENAAAARGAARKLRSHLRSVARMEHISLGTVF